MGTVGSLIGERPPRRCSRDFRRDNIQAVRKLDRELQRQRAEQSQPAEPAFKLRQFGNVPSRLYETPPRNKSDFANTEMEATPPRRSASTPALTPNKASPAKGRAPKGISPWTLAPRRDCCEVPRGTLGSTARASSSARAVQVPEAAKRTLAFAPLPRGRPSKEPAPAGAKASQAPTTPRRPRSAEPRARAKSAEGPRRGPGAAQATQASQAKGPRARPASARSSDKRAPARSSSRGAARRGGGLGQTAPLQLLPDWWGTSAEAEEAGGDHERAADDFEDAFERPQAAQAESEEYVPRGYRLMGEEERLSTCAELRTKLRDLNRRYSELPLKIETEGQRQLQQALRTKIAEVEDAEKLFSRPKVLIEI